MLMHFVNNGTIVLLVAWPQVAVALLGDAGRPNTLLLLAAALALLAGLRLLPKAVALTEPAPELSPGPRLTDPLRNGER
jgi:hypothetical protein